MLCRALIKCLSCFSVVFHRSNRISTNDKYRARLRFRVSKKLDVDSHEYVFSIGNTRVVLSPPSPNEKIRDSEWVILNARGFETEEDAWAFGNALALACESASAATRLGVDCGINRPTCDLAQAVKDRIKESTDTIVRGNVHGLDVFVDAPNVSILSIQGTGTVRVRPDKFIETMSEIVEASPTVSQETRDVLLLLNYALMRPDPVSKIVFCISAVEMLGQNQEWSPSQAALIVALHDEALRNTDHCDEVERAEVANAIKKGLHKLSLRQGALRLLDSLGCSDLKREWDRLYGKRSTLVHGLAPEPGVDYSQLATDVVNFCGQVLLRYIAREIPQANKFITEFYPVNIGTRR